MKKGLIFTAALALLFGAGVAAGAHQGAREARADSTRDVYFNIIDTSDFAQGNERYAVYAFGSGDAWYDMSKYGGEGNFYKATIDSKYTSVIFCRMNKEAAENNWDNEWDQSEDLELGVSTTYFKATEKKANYKIGGEWYDASPAAETNLFYVYDANESLGDTLANINIYGFGAANTVLPSVWPGVHSGISSTTEGGRSVYRVELSTSFTKFILNNGTVQTANVEDLSDHIGDVLVLGAADGEGHFTTSWQELEEFNDHPAAEGYYLLGTKSNWKFAGSTQIPSIVKDAHNNVAILSNYAGAKDEKVRVRSWKNETKEWLTCITDSIDDVGEKVGDDFVFSDAAAVDIYVFDDNGTYKFSVAKHVELLTISIANRYFIGSAFEKTDAAPAQDCVKGAEFTPNAQATKDGYVARGYYTNEACTVKFENGTPLNESTTLYAKYTKVGYYVISGADNWSIDAAVAMNTAGIASGNKAEAYITVSAVNETYSFVYYDAEGHMSGQDGLGAGYDETAVAYEEGHLKFLKVGSYAIYFANDNLVYLNSGATAFCTNFISEIGGICKTNNTTDLDDLKAEWLVQKAAFEGLLPAEQAVLTAVGFNGGDEEGTIEQQVIAKYHYIVMRYGTVNCPDFIFGGTYKGSQLGSFNMGDTSTSSALVVSIAAITVTALSFGLVMMLKKRKEN